MIYEMKLNDEPFNSIKNGTKTIEMRLYDEKRKLLKLGDYISFTNIKTNEVMKVEIVGLYRYESFKELYNNFSSERLGYSKGEKANFKDMEKYYSKEEQEKYGVLAIEVKKV